MGLLIKGDVPKELIGYFVMVISFLDVVVSKGFLLVVTLALVFSSNTMMRLPNLVWSFDACETMGCATTICTNKTGTLDTIPYDGM